MVSNHNNNYKKKLKVLIQPNIRFDSKTRHSVLKILNFTLADEALLSTETRVALSSANGAGIYYRHILFDQHKQLILISNRLLMNILSCRKDGLDSVRSYIDGEPVHDESQKMILIMAQSESEDDNYGTNNN